MVSCERVGLNCLCVTGFMLHWRVYALPQSRCFTGSGMYFPSLWSCELVVRLSSLGLYVLGVYWPSLWLCALGVGLSNMRCVLGVYLPCATAILPWVCTYSAGSVYACRAYSRGVY